MYDNPILFLLPFFLALVTWAIGRVTGYRAGYRAGYVAGTRAARGLPVGYRLPQAHPKFTPPYTGNGPDGFER